VITPKAPEKKVIINEDGEEVVQDEIDEDELKRMLRP
jgi:hypothetical protein